MSAELVPFSNDLEAVTAVIQAANLADSTKVKYCRVVASYLLGYGGRLTDSAELAAFAADLSQSRKAQLKAAVKLWSEAMIDRIKAQAVPANIDEVQAAIYRFQALQTAVKVKAANGTKAHTWLSQAEVKKLLSLPEETTIIGQRDRLALGLLVAAGLRREEAVKLVFGDVKLQPIRGKIRTVLEIQGKGDKARLVPIRDSLAAAIEEWNRTVGPGRFGNVLRSVDQTGVIGDDLTGVGLFNIVRGYGREMNKPSLAPHDLRRTYAQIGYESGVPITQISKLLGHSSIATTQRYLNLSLDLETTVSDFVPF
ncbi:MAG: site-specific integrase [Candidatus Promineifilaceae bacterium]